MTEAMMQFGVAGLMGALWVWERTHSRWRERQLSESHHMITQRDQNLEVLVKLVRQNTKAVVGFDRTLKRTCKLLEGIGNEMGNQEAA